MTTPLPVDRVKSLRFWSGPVAPQPLAGGITNANFLVEDRGARYVVRVGDDIPVHGVMRFNELAASRAAFEAGLSPEIVHHEPGALVMRYVESRTLTPGLVRERAMLERILPLIQRCHRDMPGAMRGPVLMFWVFHVLRDYAGTLRDGGSRMVPELPRLLGIAEQLEEMVGPIKVVFGHNDLLAANFLDDGERLWLIDWDYAGFNSPLFDLGNLCSNNEVAPADETWLLETYFGGPLTPAQRRSYEAMKCASLLRETMWSMVSEIHSKLDFDYVAYTAENLARFDRAWRALQDF
jgi:thiamine kinase-like enzyme